MLTSVFKFIFCSAGSSLDELLVCIIKYPCFGKSKTKRYGHNTATSNLAKFEQRDFTLRVRLLFEVIKAIIIIRVGSPTAVLTSVTKILKFMA